MFLKVVDASLNCTFLAVHVMSKLRKYLLSRRPPAQEEQRLKAEVASTEKARSDLKQELDHPTTIRTYSTQVELCHTLADAREKCSVAVFALRDYRQAQRDARAMPN